MAKKYTRIFLKLLVFVIVMVGLSALAKQSVGAACQGMLICDKPNPRTKKCDGKGSYGYYKTKCLYKYGVCGGNGCLPEGAGCEFGESCSTTGGGTGNDCSTSSASSCVGSNVGDACAGGGTCQNAPNCQCRTGGGTDCGSGSVPNCVDKDEGDSCGSNKTCEGKPNCQCKTNSGLPTCTLSVSNQTIDLNKTKTVTATVTWPIAEDKLSATSVTFDSNDTNIATNTPRSDGSRPYRTVITAEKIGSTTFATKARGVRIDGKEDIRCSKSFRVTVPGANCTVNLTPNNSTISPTGKVVYTASVNPSNGTVNKVNFSSSRTTRANVSPKSDSSSAYKTTATGLSTGTVTITANVIMNGFSASKCSDSSTLTIVDPSCTVTLNPSSSTISVDADITHTASVNADGTIDRVNFSSDSSSVATVSPTSDSSSVYRTTTTGKGGGLTTIKADVVMGGETRCSASAAVTVTKPSPWVGG